MMKRKMLVWAALALFPALALGQAYPSRPVRVIIPFAPGGASDFVGRILQPRLGELLGQQIVVENRAGAAGSIGVEAAAKAAARRLHRVPGQHRHHRDQPFRCFPIFR